MLKYHVAVAQPCAVSMYVSCPTCSTLNLREGPPRASSSVRVTHPELKTDADPGPRKRKGNSDPSTVERPTKSAKRRARFRREIASTRARAEATTSDSTSHEETQISPPESTPERVGKIQPVHVCKSRIQPPRQKAPRYYSWEHPVSYVIPPRYRGSISRSRELLVCTSRFYPDSQHR